MSLLVHLGSLGDSLKNFKQVIPHNFQLSTTQKVAVVTVSASIALLGVLAKYMRRKKQHVDIKKLRRPLIKRHRPSGIRSPNADLASVASSGRRSNALSGLSDRMRHSSIANAAVSERASIASGSVASSVVAQEDNETGPLNPQQLGAMGMEALETCIAYWEDALNAYRSGEGSTAGPLAVLGPEEANFCKELQHLLEAAQELQYQSEVLFLDEQSVLFRPGSGDRKISNQGIDADLSGGESFASAQDQVADLREFEEFTELFPDLESLPLYQAALRQLENGGIPCRSLRTELVKCGTDGEYLAKLHCLRLAFQHIFKDGNHYVWFVDSGRQMLADLILWADKDPKDFLIGYEDMLRYLQDASNWYEIEEELSSKGVKALTFYDVVLDYILMDAFEDLESPPSSVTAVVQNRWLSNGFKETALTTAVWSVLKAKRRMLRFPNGFMAHFYTISEQLSPLMAWGFLGPDESLKETCLYFKEQVMGFLIDIFNFQKSKFTTIEELSSDILIHLRARVDNVTQRLALPT